MTKSNRRTKRELVRDLVLYIVISVSVVSAILLHAVYFAKTKQSSELATRWIGFSFMTLILFVNVFRAHKFFWGQRRLWKLMAPISALHLVMGYVIISRMGIVRLSAFVFPGLIEYFTLTALLNRFLVGQNDVEGEFRVPKG